jgi:hypothetical protein
MKAVGSIADTVRGDFERQFDAITLEYFAACRKVTDTWLRGVANQPGVKRLEHGNITYEVGAHTRFFVGSQKYAKVYEDKLRGGKAVLPKDWGTGGA